jgi:hypothetical protein
MIKTLIGALVLGVGGAPAVVAWCLTLCSPTHEAAVTPTAAGHCALHGAGDAASQVTTPGMEGCATAHDAGYGLVDAKSPDKVVRLSAPATVQLTLDPTPVHAIVVRGADAAPPVTPSGVPRSTPLRL